MRRSSEGLAEADREDRLADQARSAAEHEPDADQHTRAAIEAAEREACGDQAREDGRVTYDSAERRDATASELRAKGTTGDVVDTWMRADMSQARLAMEAVVTRTAGRSPETRKSRVRAARLSAQDSIAELCRGGREEPHPVGCVYLRHD